MAIAIINQALLALPSIFFAAYNKHRKATIALEVRRKSFMRRIDLLSSIISIRIVWNSKIRMDMMAAGRNIGACERFADLFILINPPNQYWHLIHR